MIRLTSFRKPVLVSIVLGASFTARAEVPMCSVLDIPLVPMVADLPFTGDVVGSRWGYLPDGSEGHKFKLVYSIARDSDGRVSAKDLRFEPKSGRMAFSMTICDPLSGTRTSFHACVDGAHGPTSSDGCAVEKVAQVRPGPHRKPDSGLPVFPDPFKPEPAHHASSFVPGSGELVDLGEKDMEGVRVHGYHHVGTHHGSCNGVPLTTSREWWLSEKAALEVSVTTRTSFKEDSEASPTSRPVGCLSAMTIELTNIQQVEPERELFQVPPNYKIVPIDNTWKPKIKPE
jgi:hypothetical protein